jgi:hypothetical protein
MTLNASFPLAISEVCGFNPLIADSYFFQSVGKKHTSLPNFRKK